jgi:hypothetical protein
MKRFTSSIRKAVRDGNLFAALFVSLAMPDICGALEKPQASVGERYRAWFERYLKPKYDPTSHFEFLSATMPQAIALLPPEAIAEMKAPFDPTLSFSAEDCYMCRCKCLHQGILEKSRRERFIFITPLPNGAVLHRNLRNGQLVLQIDIFAEDMCLGVEAWEQDVKTDSAVATRISELMTFTEWFNL